MATRPEFLKGEPKSPGTGIIGKEMASDSIPAGTPGQGPASPRAALSALSRHFDIPCIDLERYHPDEKSVSMVPEEIARRFQILPLFELGGHLYIATINPEDLSAIDYLAQLTGLTVEPVVALKESLTEVLNSAYLTVEKTAKTMGTYVDRRPREVLQLEAVLRLEDEQAPAIKLLNFIITQAINLGASDIHIEPFANRVLMRYRVDGILHEFPPPPFHIFKALISRIKIISNLDVAERRLPQDGRASFSIDGRELDLRMSIIPNVYGEGAVIRILDTLGFGKGLEDLGFSPQTIERYEKHIRKPYGILLVTGPTGSGKSTTLYATLKRIFTPRKKIITLEDPVEYKFEGITQIQVNADIGFSFAAGLRSILRHDPDIIMLGEIRDLETAEIAIRSSLTGHMVFSTLHTNDSASAVTRLLDMGVPSFLVFASLSAVVAQRLVRRLCPRCRTSATIGASELSALGITKIPEGSRIYEPAGCASCSNLGYKGRSAIYELLEITPEMRQLDVRGITPDALRKLAHKGDFKTLRESAMEKMFAGITSLEEVLALTVVE